MKEKATKNVTNKNLREAAEKSVAGMITMVLCAIMIVAGWAIEQLLMKVRENQKEVVWMTVAIIVLFLIVGLIVGVFSTALYIARKLGGNFLQRKLIMQRIRTRSDSEREFDEKRKLILEILSRLNVREMRGEEFSRILERLDSQSIEELNQTQKDLLEGEEQIRAQIIREICRERDVSAKQKEKLKENLSGLTLSELEVV